MTREEAKVFMLQFNTDKRLNPSEHEAIRVAIKALSVEPCEAGISREDMDECKELMTDINGDTVYAVRMSDIRELPSVTPARPNAHNNNEDYAECDQFVCSNCGIELQDWHRVECDEDDGEVSYHEYTFKYCPNCGAKMENE